MKFYQDITLLPDDDIGVYFLWEKLYQQIHLALVENLKEHGQQSVAVSFPKYSVEPYALGNQLRLLANNQSDLVSLNINEWLCRLSDYVHIKGIKPVPDNITEFVCFSKQEIKFKKSKLKRMMIRKAKREGITESAALKTLSYSDTVKVKTPFVYINSLSQQTRFPLFILKTRVNEAERGVFSSYGLSKTVTVPWF